MNSTTHKSKPKVCPVPTQSPLAVPDFAAGPPPSADLAADLDRIERAERAERDRREQERLARLRDVAQYD